SHYSYGASVKVFCIRTEGPVEDKFVRRFAADKVPVVWNSECESGPMGIVREKKSGSKGMRMSIVSFAWLNGTEAEAKVEAFSDGLAANDNTLRVKFRKREWLVVHDRLDGVS